MFAIKGKLLAALGLWLGFCITIAAAQAQNSPKIQASQSGSKSESESQSWKPMQPRKRQAIVKLDPLGSAAAKSYDPPPEFYRGPGSSASSSASKLDSTAAGFISKPIGALPPVGGGSSSQAENLSEAYEKWRLGGNIHDRISVGHYSSGGGSAGKSYAYDSHPYAYDYGSANGHGYEPGPSQGHGYSGSGEAGVPYHVYRPRPDPGHYPPDFSYSYSSYPVDSHEVLSHKGSPELSPKALLAKSFLIPLASATVLGIAAALISNPLLLQLAPVPVPGIGVGVGVGPPVVGKRRRRRREAGKAPRET
ncbi:uncharacterized protein LOC108099801 [Drosophila ficusphila]|uniref:uncharacterized protein LOC108099801 n=1 Tax=Drosophila ficusphila TaxID=30025 RepID=UPI0007E669B5|nr:uncharacterized protein LOC108099801 [Drosophila ficusphila]